jgi:hypothetical protein
MSGGATGPKYLGGIGMMLEAAHICPRCGQELPDSPTASTWHLAGKRCRPTVFAALPEAPDPKPVEAADDVPPVSAVRRIHDYEVQSGAPALSESGGVAIPGSSGVSRSLPVPWLRPPDLGEVL